MSEARGTGPLPTEALPTNEEAARWVADGRNLEQNEELHRNEYLAATEEATRTRLSVPQSFTFIHAVNLDKRLSDIQRRVGIYIQMRVNKTLGYAWPSQGRIAEELCCSRECVNAAVKKLVALGYLKTDQQPGGKKALHYWLCLPRAQQ